MKIWIHAYPIDNQLNTFGDFTHLVSMQFAPMSPRLNVLTNFDKGLHRVLTGDEFEIALKTIFTLVASHHELTVTRASEPKAFVFNPSTFFTSAPMPLLHEKAENENKPVENQATMDGPPGYAGDPVGQNLLSKGQAP